MYGHIATFSLTFIQPKNIFLNNLCINLSEYLQYHIFHHTYNAYTYECYSLNIVLHQHTNVVVQLQSSINIQMLQSYINIQMLQSNYNISSTYKCYSLMIDNNLQILQTTYSLSITYTCYCPTTCHDHYNPKQSQTRPCFEL